MGFGGIVAGALGGMGEATADIARRGLIEEAQDRARVKDTAAADERAAAIARRNYKFRQKERMDEVSGPLADAKLEYQKRLSGQEQEAAAARERAIQAARRAEEGAYATPEGAAALKGLRARAEAMRAPERRGATDGISAQAATLRQQALTEIGKLRAAGDTQGIAAVEQRLAQDLAVLGHGSKAETIRPADQLKGAKELFDMAKGLREQALMVEDTANKEAILAQAKELEALAASTTRGIVSRNQTPGASAPGGSPRQAGPLAYAQALEQLRANPTPAGKAFFEATYGVDPDAALRTPGLAKAAPRGTDMPAQDWAAP